MPVGDVVYVTKEALGMVDEPMEVIEVDNPDYIPFMGEGCVTVIDKDGEGFIASRSEYRTVSEVREENEESKRKDSPKSNYISPEHRTSDMKRLLYVAMQEGEDVYIFDNKGKKVTLSKDEYVHADPDDVLDYIYELDNKIEGIRSVIDETLSLIKDDIGHNLGKLRD